VALAASALLTPLTVRLAWSVGAVDPPRERRLSDRAMLRLGGLAILAGTLLAGVWFLPAGEETRGILLGAVVITLVGAVDDVVELHPLVKLTGQAAAASIPVLAGVTVSNITLPFIGAVDFGNAGAPLTLIGRTWGAGRRLSRGGRRSSRSRQGTGSLISGPAARNRPDASSERRRTR
jgi:UDP-GlcNAc:undecaprenyl-phosphate GlcNAc-1-phosphate transferase